MSSQISEEKNNATTTGDLYNIVYRYDFSSDPEFRKGLGTILGRTEPASDAEVASGDDVVLQAKCFYISRFVFSISSIALR